MPNSGKSLKKLKEYETKLEDYPCNIELLYQKGIILNYLGCYSSALKTYNLALEIDPLTPRILYAKGTSLFYLKRYEEALDVYEQVIKINSNYLDIKTKINQVLTKLEIQKLNQQLKIYEDESRINPVDSEIFFNKGSILLKLKKYGEAVKAFDMSLKLNPGDAEVLSGKGDALFYLGRYEEAIKIYSDSLNIKPDYLSVQNMRVSALIKMGNIYLNNRRYLNAVQFYNESLSSGKESVENEILLSLSKSISDLLDPKKYTDLKLFCEVISRIRLEQSKKEVLYDKITSCLSKSIEICTFHKKANEIVGIYDVLLEIDPKNIKILSILADSLDSFKLYDSSIKVYEKAVLLDPNNVCLIVKLGNAYLNNGDYVNAFERYDKSLRLRINNPIGSNSVEYNIYSVLSKAIRNLINSKKYSEIGLVYKGISRIALRETTKDSLAEKISLLLSKPLESCEISKSHNEIRMICDILLEIKLSDIKILRTMGHLLSCLYLYDKALETYGELLALDPCATDVWCFKGDILSELKRYDEALEAYEKALGSNPGNAELLFLKGNALLELGNYFEALNAYEKALEINPDWPELWRRKGNVFSKLGFLDEAQEAYSKLEELHNRQEPRNKEWYDIDNPINRYHLYK